MSKLTTRHILDINNSDYEFKRHEVVDFKENISVTRFMFSTSSFSQWKGAAIIFDSIKDKFLSNGEEIYCFIVSPCWKKSSRIVRHFGLGKALGKDYSVGPLNFLFEKEIVNGEDVIFCGLVKLTSANCIAIFNLLSTYENGVLLSSTDIESVSCDLLIEELIKLVIIKSVSSSFNLEIVKAIELITNMSEKALYPYAWEETGEYHLDMFERR